MDRWSDKDWVVRMGKKYKNEFQQLLGRAGPIQYCRVNEYSIRIIILILISVTIWLKKLINYFYYHSGDQSHHDDKCPAYEVIFIIY